ncbi:MAG TPA: cytochrome P450 [Pseudonocardiaceae bacterium]|nr:cytochrome P450 [Pseudonocardiaceae bacterium]
MSGDFRLGMTMFVWRAALRAQNLIGDPAARVLGRGPNTDPYRRYEKVREDGELVRSKLGVYVTASHGLANSVLRDGRFGVQTTAGMGRDDWQADRGKRTGHVHPIEDSFLSLDPPTHTRLRRLVAPWFTPRALRDRTERIEKIVARFLDDIADRDRFDLIGDFAVRVPIQVICDLLGVPDDEYPRFVRWGAIVALALDSTWTLTDYRRLRIALAEMSEFFTALVAERRKHPGDDIVSELATSDEPLAISDLLATVELLLVAGFETTVNLIGNGVIELLRNRDARDWLLAHPDRADDIVEEVLRHDPPVQYTMRLAHQPLTLAGTELPTDTGVVLLLAGANRDPAVFADPERFDPTRSNNREHLAFSAGIHYCLGAGLARIEAAVALRALFERYPDLSAAGAAKRRRSRNIRGVRVLPVRGRAVRTLSA